jgi:hypothetical protein
MLEGSAPKGNVVAPIGCTLKSPFGRPGWKGSTARAASGSHRNGKLESEWAAEASEHKLTTERTIENSEDVSVPGSE